MSASDLLVVAGEASGDQHAARLVSALRERRSDLVAFGLGSDALRQSGAELLADSREISVVGISEALGVLERAREIFHALLAECDRRRPAAAVLVDFPEFNLRLARELSWRGVPVVYYVSPQLWAWRRGRIRIVREYVDRMLLLFPFELAFYQQHGVDAIHVGHPLVDEVPVLPQAWDRIGEHESPARFRVALLPGSRRREVELLLPIMLGALARLAESLQVEAVILRAPTIEREQIERYVGDSHFAVEIEETDRFAAIAASHLAISASGTATLETGLLGTPLIVIYKLSIWTWTLAKWLVRVPHVSLVNLVLGGRTVPELLQSDASVERLAATAAELLRSREQITRMRSELAGLRRKLGAPGATERAADAVLALLAERRRAA